MIYQSYAIVRFCKGNFKDLKRKASRFLQKKNSSTFQRYNVILQYSNNIASNEFKTNYVQRRAVIERAILRHFFYITNILPFILRYINKNNAS